MLEPDVNYINPGESRLELGDTYATDPSPGLKLNEDIHMFA